MSQEVGKIDWPKRWEEANKEFLGLSYRAKRTLVSQGILTISQLSHKSDKELLKIRGFGKKCLAEIYELLNCHGIRRQPKCPHCGQVMP